MTAHDHAAAAEQPPPGFGRRNVHCSNCGDERGGPFGHETSECGYRSGMVAWQVAELLPEHRRSEFWEQAIDRYLAAEMRKLWFAAAAALADLGRDVRAKREELGLSREQLAEQLGAAVLQVLLAEEDPDVLSIGAAVALLRWLAGEEST